MRLSNIAAGLETSLTRQLFNRAKNMPDVIDLTLGDPDLVPSLQIRNAACDAIQAGKTRYSVNAGLSQAREAIARCVEKEYAIPVDDRNEIMLTIGGMGALYLSLAALINPGDEVLVIGPYYVNYIQMITMCGGIPVVVYTKAENDFQIEICELEKAVTEKTVALMINSPCNPSGSVICSSILDELALFVKKHHLAVISDEVYRTLLYDDLQHESIITRPGMKDYTILVDSMSKRFAMTGYRCGFAVGPEPLISAMTKMQENIASCTPLPSQYAAITAYSFCQNEHWIREEFEKRRNYIWHAVNQIPGLSCAKPAATFYLFVNIDGTGLDSISFSNALLDAQHVAVVPGITYGKPYHNYIRIAYTLPVEKLQEAIDRITRFATTLMKG